MPANKTQEHAAVEKPHSKPGRKPLNSEPKNKRTAQNRAAQRAFRERKEKRMKELEDKVYALEQEKSQIANESEFLRSQVNLLLKQLNKNGIRSELPIEEAFFKTVKRNNESSNDLLNKTMTKSETDDDFNDNDNDNDNESFRVDTSSDEKNTNNMSSNSSVSSTTPGSFMNDDVYRLATKELSLSSLTSPNDVNNLNLDLDLNFRNKLNNHSFKDNYDEQMFCNQLSQVCGSKENPIPKQKLKSFSSNSVISTPSIMSTNAHLNNTSNKSPFSSSLFDGSINSETNYLSDLNKDLASMEQNNKRGSSKNSPSFWNFDLGFEQFNSNNNNNNTNTSLNSHDNDDLLHNKQGGFNNISSLNTTPNNVLTPHNTEMDFLKQNNNETMKLIENNPNAFQLDPTSALFTDSLNNNFDVDFDDDDVFEDLLKLPDGELDLSKNSNNPPIQSIINTNNTPDETDKVININNEEVDDDNEKVPDNTQSLMKCSQIWERITTHPRFTDLDIDNLCDELKQKAKCSESGVVVDGNDVGKLLHRAICDKQKEKQKEREIDIKRMALSTGSNGFLQGMW